MVHSFLASPFADEGRTTQFAAVRAAFQADAAAPNSLLLGNLVLEDGTAPLDAVVVQPHGITLLMLVPTGGQLSIPAVGYGRWQLDGAPLPGPEEFDNPFEAFRQQKSALAAWLRPRFSLAQADLRCITGLVVFGAPVTFAPNVALALAEAPVGFQLVREAASLPQHLEQLATPEINLSANDITEWAAEWAAFVAGPPAAPAASQAAQVPQAEEVTGFIGQKARALWGWLGAHDVPDDPAYGHNPATVAARSQEKEQLERLRQQMQADLSSQLQALEARETERERSIAQLRAELAQAPPVAAEATALVSRLGAETREKAALEAEIQASRAESAARNEELNTKIQQLSQLIAQLSAVPVATAPMAAPVVSPSGYATGSSASVVPPRTTEPEPPKPAPDNSLNPAPVRPAAVGRPGLAEWLSIAGQKVREATVAAQPPLQQMSARVRRQPRVAAAVAGAVLLGVWGLSHLGGSPPVPFQENGRWGYADGSGTAVVPAQYAAASPFQAGQAVVAKDGVYGSVNEKGQEVVPLVYDALNPYAGGFARARVGEAYTFLDEAGQEFDHYYFNALDFAEGHAAVLDHRGWHYISGAEEAEKPAIFLEAYSFAEGVARVKLRDGYTYITSAYLADPSRGTKPFGRYQLATDFADGKAHVTQNGRRFVIDKDGEEVK